MSAPRARARRLGRALVALARERLGASSLARFGRGGAIAIASGYAVVAVVLRAADGPAAPLAGLVASAAPSIAWIGAGSIALAAAHDRAAVDRRDGIALLAGSRGASSEALAAARVVAAMIAIGRGVGLPLIGLALLVAAIAGSASGAARGLAVTLAALVFSAICGVTLGAVAAACGSLGARRGRSFFVAVVVVPWLLADLAGLGAWSLPGALGAALDTAMRLAGAGPLA